MREQPTGLEAGDWEEGGAAVVLQFRLIITALIRYRSIWPRVTPGEPALFSRPSPRAHAHASWRVIENHGSEQVDESSDNMQCWIQRRCPGTEGGQDIRISFIIHYRLFLRPCKKDVSFEKILHVWRACLPLAGWVLAGLRGFLLAWRSPTLINLSGQESGELWDRIMRTYGIT